MEPPKAPPEMLRPRGAESTGHGVWRFSTMDRAPCCSLERWSGWLSPNHLGRQKLDEGKPGAVGTVPAL